MVIKGNGLDEQITSFGTCDLTEDKCGDALLLDKILLCFLEIQKRIEMKPNNEGGEERLFILIIETFRKELSSAPNPSCNQRSASEFDRCRNRETRR